MSRIQIQIAKEPIVAFCKAWRVQQFALFGAAMVPGVPPEAGIDVLLTFLPESHWTLLDRVDMQDQLQAIFRRPVHVVNRQGLHEGFNFYYEQAVLANSEVVVAAQ